MRALAAAVRGDRAGEAGRAWLSSGHEWLVRLGGARYRWVPQCPACGWTRLWGGQCVWDTHAAALRWRRRGRVPVMAQARATSAGWRRGTGQLDLCMRAWAAELIKHAGRAQTRMDTLAVQRSRRCGVRSVHAVRRPGRRAGVASRTASSRPPLPRQRPRFAAVRRV